MRNTLTASALALVYALAPTPALANPAAAWTGCYAGVGAAYGHAKIATTSLGQLSPSSSSSNEPVGDATAEGPAAGGQLGCDLQIREWVFGAQASLAAADVEGDHVYRGGTSSSNRVYYDVKRVGTLTGRAGYLVRPDTLAYLKGGMAWATTAYQDNDPTWPYTSRAETTRKGWLIGVGGEHKLQRNLSLFAEYAYMQFGKDKLNLSYSTGEVYRYNFEQRMSTVSVGANYRFR